MERTSENQNLNLCWRVWEQLGRELWKSLDEIVGTLCIQKSTHWKMIVFLRQDIENVLALLLKSSFIEKSGHSYRI